MSSGVAIISPLAALLACAQLLGGCASLPQPPCPPGEQSEVSDLLYFGTARPGGTVSAEEWSQFLQAVVTPRFPAGLTVWKANGQWRSAAGSTEREASYVLSLVHPESESSEAAIRSIVSEYKARFRQEAVLRVKTAACVS